MPTMEAQLSTKRLDQIRFDIRKCQAQLAQTFRDEQQLSVCGRDSGQELAEIASERTLLENSLANLSKEEHELLKGR